MRDETTVYPLVQLVDNPDVSAKVRFDFNDGLTWADHDGFSLGAPALDGDPGSVGAGYGYRTVSLTAVVEGNEAQALTIQSRLARELFRDEGWLLFRLSPTAEPMWLRCVRSAPGQLSLGNVFLEREENQYVITLALVGDPFAVGEEVSHEVTVGNDPASAGLTVELPVVKGDAPAPLTVEFASGATEWIQPLLSVAPLDSPASDGQPGVLEFRQAETLTLADFVAASNEAAASGGKVAAITLTTTNDMARRITAQWAPRYAGRYRIFARVQYNATTADPPVIRVAGAGGAVVASRSTDLTVNGGRLVELGTYAFPKGNPPATRPYQLGPGEVGVDVARIATGSGISVDFVLRVDYLVAFPVDLPLDQAGPVTTLEFTDSMRTSGNRVLRINGDAERVEEVTTTGQHYPATPEVPVGGYVRVVPGARNVLTVLTRRRSSATRFADDITTTAKLRVSYRPRFLWLAST